MSNVISGNVAGATGKTVYLVQRHTAYSPYAPTPQQYVTDGSGNYTFTVQNNGPYFLYTVASQPGMTKVVVSDHDVPNVNFAA